MNAKWNTEEVESLIAEGRLTAAVELVYNALTSKDSDFKNKIIAIKNRCVNLENNNHKGIIPQDNYEAQRNKILFDFLSLISSGPSKGAIDNSDDVPERQETKIEEKVDYIVLVQAKILGAVPIKYWFCAVTSFKITQFVINVKNDVFRAIEDHAILLEEGEGPALGGIIRKISIDYGYNHYGEGDYIQLSPTRKRYSMKIDVSPISMVKGSFFSK